MFTQLPIVNCQKFKYILQGLKRKCVTNSNRLLFKDISIIFQQYAIFAVSSFMFLTFSQQPDMCVFSVIFCYCRKHSDIYHINGSEHSKSSSKGSKSSSKGSKFSKKSTNYDPLPHNGINTIKQKQLRYSSFSIEILAIKNRDNLFLNNFVLILHFFET